MTHPAYLLARLNPKNVRFDIGTGGVPELTSTDIAAALGMVPAGIGRDLLSLTWWPDSRADTAPRLQSALAGALMAEWCRRESAMVNAMLSVAQSAGGSSLRRARDMYAEAHQERWPSINQVNKDLRSVHEPYSALPAAVIAEIVSPKRCPDCGGTGVARTRTGLARCKRCNECGVIPTGNTDRADALGIKEYQYRKTWDRPYAWLLEECGEQLRKAGKALESAAA